MSSIRNWAFTITFAAMIGILAACGGGGKDKPKDAGVRSEGQIVEPSAAEKAAARQREKKRQRAREAAPQDFTYFRYRIDTSDDQPLACFVFSAPLDPETDYSPFLSFKPEFQPALSVTGRELCVGGLGFGTSHTATLLTGLPAADGRSLDHEERVPIDFSDRPAYVGFKGGGVILPRADADGLPIETVNVDQVRITVSRVNDRALAFKSISQGETVAQGRYSYSYGQNNPDDVDEELWSGLMDVANEQNAPVVTVFPLQDVIGELEPGAYYVRIEDARELASNSGPPASAQRWIMMTNLALVAYQGEHGLDVTLRSLKDGKQISAAKVQLIARNNDVLAEARTDEKGRVQFDAPLTRGTGNLSPRLIMAFGAKGDLAVLDLTRAPVDLSGYETGGRRTPGAVDAYLYTERGIYRPGESVEMTALLRDRAGRRINDRAGFLRIMRPNGMEAAKVRFSEPESGAVLESYALPRGASRGVWRAVLDIDGMSRAGEVSFSVEDFVPQRIAAEMEGDEDKPLRMDEEREMVVKARFLYGAPGAGLVVKSQMRVEPDPNPFPDYKDFSFGRHDASFHQRIIELPDQTTDGAGLATLVLDPEGYGRDADRPLRLNTVVSVLEPGGRAVNESARIPYRPRDLYLATKADFEYSVPRGEEAGFEILALGANGKAVKSALSWKVLEIDYHYDWYRDGGRWRYRRSRTVRTVNEGLLTTPAGGTGEITVDGLDWGDHELVVTGPDGEETSRQFWVGWGGRTSDDGVDAPDRVRVMAPENTPEIGQNTVVTIVPPYDGVAQIVVATDRILNVLSVPVESDGTSVSLPVTSDWGEGAYVMVNVYTKRDPVLQAKPRRAAGVQYIPVNMKDRTFELTIDAPDKVRPRREQLIEVEIEGGPKEPVFLTLAAVDEGILQLTKFSSPDPVDYYYGKKALGVSLYDDYGRLLDPNMGLPAEVRTGGDQLGGEGLTVVPTKSVALFSGLVDVGRSGKAKIRFQMPDFNGELRLMAVAWSKNGLGRSSRPITVRDPAPSELIMPRFLAPGDEAVLTASIDNVELDAGEFKALVTAAGPVAVAAGNVTRRLAPGERADEPIRITADETGIARLRLSVNGPQNFAVDHQYKIQTRSPYLPETRVKRDLLEPGEAFSVGADLLEGYVPGSSEVTVSFSSLPVDPAALYASLARYPYGCTEQTTSRAMPLLYSEELVAMGANKGNDDPRTKVQEAVTRILNRQSADGAFGLWREGDGYASPWLGAYATDFIYRAKTEGYAVPDEALRRAYGALRNISTGDKWRISGYDTDRYYYGRYNNDSDEKMMQRASAYALYVLAKAGEADISRLRYLHDRELSEIESPLARAHIAAGLAYMGDRSRARSAFEAAIDALGYDNTGDYYQTELRDLAGVLALASETEFSDIVERLAEKLGDDTPEPSELTTQEKAFLLLAVDSLSGGEEGMKVKVSGLGRGNDNERSYAISEAQALGGVDFTYKGKTPLFRTVLVTGAPIQAPKPITSKLGALKRYYTLRGKPVSLSEITQGDQLVVRLTLDPKERRLNPVIVADLLPAGFEIETILRPADGKREDGDSGAFAWLGEIAAPKTVQSQDDRYIAAVDLYDDDATLAYVVRAVTPGQFANPGVVAEDMYRPDVFGRSRASTLKIAPRMATAGGDK